MKVLRLLAVIGVCTCLFSSVKAQFTSPFERTAAHDPCPSNPAGDTLPPPYFTIYTDEDASPGSLFLANVDYNTFTYSSYILIVSNQGEIIQKMYVPAIVTDFKLHENGELSYFNTMTNAHYIIDSNFNYKRSIVADGGYKTDNHEIHLLKNGHVILLAKEDIIKDLSGTVIGGKHEARITGNVIQEFDGSGVKIFEWHSKDYISVNDMTHEPINTDYIDLTHMNTIEIDHDDNLVLSSRNLDEITKIDRQTGKIIWRFGGKNNQFKLIGDTMWFSRQHSVRVLPNGNYILFDNGNYNIPQVSRICEYKLDTASMTATLVWEFRHPGAYYAYAMGSVQYLPDYDRFLIGWGTNTNVSISEVSRDQKINMELKMSGTNISYRVFKFPWQKPQTGVKEADSEKQSISAFPNPATSHTNVIYSLAEASSATLTLEDELGRVVTSHDLGVKQKGGHTLSLPLATLAKGIYFCKLQTALGIKVTKISVQ